MLPHFEEVIDRFESAWRSERRPSILPILRNEIAGASEIEQRALAIELVKVDLEYRWRAAQARGRRTALRLEAYTGRLPILGPVAQLPLDLIAEEYRVRRRFGDVPGHHEYFARFGHPRAELGAALEAVDRELSTEGLPVAAPAPTISTAGYGNLVLKRQIGSGGMCRVYAGLDRSLNREVAIKVLRRRFWNSASAVSAFVREGSIVAGLAKLKTKGIVAIHCLGPLPRGGYFMLMDLVDGLDLRARWNSGAISPHQAAGWVAATADVVGGIHAAGFFHGDLKPANILVEYGGNVRVTDFGFAGTLGQQHPRLRSAAVGGTLAFLAPERAGEAAPFVSPAVDVFGLGGVLFWLLAGKAVHEQQSPAELLQSLTDPRWEANVSDRVPPSTPPKLTELCRRCLSRNPDDRPDVASVAADLRRWIADQSAGA